MITFKQKEFLAPVIAAALIGGAGTGASIISGKKQTQATNESQERVAKMQAAQAKKMQKAQEEEAKKNREIQEKQLRAAQKQEKDLMRLAKRNPQAAAAVKPTAIVTADVNQNQQNQQEQQGQLGQQKQAMFSFGTILSAGSAGLTAVSSGMQLKAAKTEAAENTKAATDSLNAATKESEAKIKNANINYKNQKQALKDNEKSFKAELAKAKQKSYSVDPNKKKEVLGFVKNLKQLASDRGVKKTIMKTAVGGAAVVGTKYLVDKAIQKDIKKSGLEKVNEETPEQAAARKKSRKRALLIGAGTAATAIGAGIAAKKGAFGTNAQKWANTNLTKANFKAKAIGTKNAVKNGFLDAYTNVDETGKRKLDKLGVGLTAVGVAAPVAKYALAKRAHKNQIQQSKGESQDENIKKQPENRTYSNIKATTNTPISSNSQEQAAEQAQIEAKKKARKRAILIGTGVTAAATIGAGIALKHTNSNSPMWMRKAKAGLYKFKKAPVKTVLGKVSDVKGGGGRKGVAKFGEDLENLGMKNNNALSQKAGKFIKENPKTALLGSIGVGIGIKKIGGLGEKAATKAIKAVDKDAFAYQDRGTTFIPKEQPNDQQEQVEKTSTPKIAKQTQPKAKVTNPTK